MPTDRTAPCEHRIDAELLSLERWYRRRYRSLDKARRADNHRRVEELEEEISPLAISKRQLIRVEFSWGGPSARIDAEVDRGEVVAATFYFLDWFDGANRPVNEGSHPALMRLAAEMAQIA